MTTERGAVGSLSCPPWAVLHVICTRRIALGRFTRCPSLGASVTYHARSGPHCKPMPVSLGVPGFSVCGSCSHGPSGVLCQDPTFLFEGSMLDGWAPFSVLFSSSNNGYFVANNGYSHVPLFGEGSSTFWARLNTWNARASGLSRQAQGGRVANLGEVRSLPVHIYCWRRSGGPLKERGG